jgi:hypothetical protein
MYPIEKLFGKQVLSVPVPKKNTFEKFVQPLRGKELYYLS